MSDPAVLFADPVLSCAAARTWETRLLGGDEKRAWMAMNRAGRALAGAVLRDFREITPAPLARVLVLAGKGHNGGDALLAARALLEKNPLARAAVLPVFGVRTLRPLALRAYQEFFRFAGGRAEAVPFSVLRSRDEAFDVCLDGIFGFQFRPPLDAPTAEMLSWINEHPRIHLRAAVDLPSGIGEVSAAPAFRADFTYATGILKTPVLAAGAAQTGRLRYLDLGFFAAERPASGDFVLTPEMLAALAALRPARSDKRSQGHLFVLGGSRQFPGAVLMTVLAALRSGVGLVTAFVPESLAPAYAARAPEAMWTPWPETPGGGLALEGISLLRERSGRATALIAGPGLGAAEESQVLIGDLLKISALPVVLDADALQPEALAALAQKPGRAAILTPHAGEFARIALLRPEDVTTEALRIFCGKHRLATVLKGPVTRIAGGQGSGVYHSLFGGPVLARGGSGDLLAGLIGGMLAQTPTEPLLAACRGAVWHGAAADCLARAHGQTAVRTTQLLDYLPEALRSANHDD